MFQAFLILAATLSAADSFRAGAARVGITPAANSSLPLSGYGSRVDGHKGIHDPLNVRAIVLDDGSRQAAIVSFDLLFVTDDMWEKLSARITSDTGIPRDFILLAGTHTHGAPALGNVKPEFETRWSAWRAAMEDRTLEAVRTARANLQPARFGIATGKAYANTNRRALLAPGVWGLGVNPEGVSDKTLAVVKFETASGAPIALLLNYAVHGTVMGPRNYEITGDLPGATSRFIEQKLGADVVAAWTSAASGDQNAIYGPGDNFKQMEVLGHMVAEEAVRVAGTVRTSPRLKLAASQRVVTCAGKKLDPASKPSEGRVAFLDADPVNIRLSLLKLNHLVLAGVSGEVLTRIGQRLQRESPFRHTLMTTHTNGSSGYLPDDAAYEQPSYEIQVSRVKQGCAEDSIVAGFVDLLDQM